MRNGRVAAKFEQVLRLLRTSSPLAENKFKSCGEQVHFHEGKFLVDEYCGPFAYCAVQDDLLERRQERRSEEEHRLHDHRRDPLIDGEGVSATAEEG